MDNLHSELDKIENWSTSLHDKVAELLKETRQKNDDNKNVESSSGSSGARNTTDTKDMKSW